MSLVSRTKFFLATALLILFATGSILLLTPKPASAASLDAKGVAPKKATGVFAITPQQSQPIQSVSIRKTFGWDDIASLGNELLCDNAVGALVSATTDTCDDTLYGSVVEGIADVVDCVTAPMDCVTDWLFNLIGSGVSWVANGIVTLVAGVHEECIPEGGSANYTNLACESRIALDYFPQGSDDATRVSTAIDAAIAEQIRNINRQLIALNKAGKGQSPEAKALREQRTQLRSTANGSADPTANNAAKMVADNAVFYTPRSAVSTSTFDREYRKYVLIGFMLLVPMIIAAALQAVITGKAALLVRSFGIHLPLAIFGMAVAPYLIRVLMAITDSFSSYILGDVRGDVKGFFTNQSGNYASMGITMLLPFGLVALVFIFAAMLVWFILSMREASVAIISMFMPIAFAASVWPALGKWILRAIKLLIAAIISKMFIVGALSLGIGTFAGSTENGGFSFSHMVFGATVFFIAAFSPHLVMKFFDEIGDALNAAGGTGAMARGLNAAANVNGTRNLVGSQGLGGMIKGGLGKGDGNVSSPHMFKSGGGPAGELGSSPAQKAATQAATAPKPGGGTGGPGGGGGAPGGGTKPPIGGGGGAPGIGGGGTDGGSSPLPAGADGGVPMNSDPSSNGLILPSSTGPSSTDDGLGGMPVGATSNASTGAYQDPGVASAPDLAAINNNLASMAPKPPSFGERHRVLGVVGKGLKLAGKGYLALTPAGAIAGAAKFAKTEIDHHRKWGGR